jgi:hypothetical protein
VKGEPLKITLVHQEKNRNIPGEIGYTVSLTEKGYAFTMTKKKKC